MYGNDRCSRHVPGSADRPLAVAAFAAFALLGACSGGAPLDGNTSGGSAPTPGTVDDGTGADIDTQSSTTTLSANWRDFEDAEGPIAGYEWSIGTTMGGTDVLGWTAVGTATSMTRAGMTLTSGTTYYVGVRASDLNGLVSAPAFSDGVLVQAGPTQPPQQTYANSVSQWGITWTFDRQYEVGQFCNGDWWVVGPVSIVQITPGSTVQSGRTINGSMINPGVDGRHGYDSTLFGQYGSSNYIPALNKATGVSAQQPLEVQPGSSLISTISQMTPDPNGSLSQLSTAAVLTVLAAPAPAGAFRPPYTGTDKTIRFNESQLDWSALANLPLVNGVPQIESVARLFERVWLDHCSDWVSRFMHPVQNMKDYGRDFSADIGSAALLVNMDFPQSRKRDLVIRLTQLGIDWLANVQAGATWPGVGGQGSGRKFPILFAGRMLNDATMRNIGHSHPSYYRGPNNTASVFGEDCQTFYVEQTSPGVYNWGYGNYDASHLGLAEWGNNHTTYIDHDSSSWTQDPYRTCCTGNAWSGYCLAMRIMNLRDDWNHPAFFDYMDRYLTNEAGGSFTRTWIDWHWPVWQRYRAQF